MSEEIQIELIRTLGVAFTGIPSIIAAWFAYKAHIGVAQVQEQTDGMKDELVTLTAKSSHAEGVIEGKLQEKENGSHE